MHIVQQGETPMQPENRNSQVQEVVENSQRSPAANSHPSHRARPKAEIAGTFDSHHSRVTQQQRSLKRTGQASHLQNLVSGRSRLRSVTAQQALIDSSH